MSEAALIARFVPLWMAVAGVVFVALLVRRAPYGRHAEERAGPTLDHLMLVAGGQNHDFVAQLGPQPQLLFDVSLHPAAVRGVKGTDIDNPHDAAGTTA